MLNYECPPIGGGAGQAHLAILRQFAGQNDLLVEVLTSVPVPGFEVKKMSDNVTVYMVGVLKKNLYYGREIEFREWLGGAARPDYE